MRRSKLKIKRGKYYYLFVGALFLLAGIAALTITLNAKPAQAAWYNDNWGYRQAVTVTVPSNGSDVNNLETLLTLNGTAAPSTLIAAGKLQSSCQDLRFTSATGKQLPYYIDGTTGCNSGVSTGKVWVLVDKVPASTTTYTVYMYYGNPSATAGSDAKRFNLFNGLVGYWPMNETVNSWNNTAGEVKDVSVKSNNGTGVGFAGTTSPTSSGQYSNAGLFNGSSQSISVPDNANLQITSALTISAWIKPTTSFSVVNEILQKGVVDYPGYQLRLDSGYLTFMVGSSSGRDFIQSSSTLTLGQWTHVVGTYDGTNIKVYVNNVLVGSKVSAFSLAASTNALTIGKRVDGYYFNGSIDDTRVYNRALSASEVSQLYANPGTLASYATTNSNPTISFLAEEKGPGPVAYWKLDEGTGISVYDSTSNKNTGTLAGTTLPTWQTEDQCISGKCLYFDGSSSYVTYGSPSLLQITGALSYSTWVRTTQTPSVTSIIIGRRTTDTAAGIATDIELTPAGKAIFVTNDGATASKNITSITTINDGKWHYITGVYVPSTSLTIYIDGKQDAQNTTSIYASLNSASLPITIGSRNGTAYFLNGFIDEPKIYNYARSAAQVQADYVGKGTAKGGNVLGVGTNGQFSALNQGLVGYWKMDEATWSGTLADVADSSGNGNNGTAACIGAGCNQTPGGAVGKFGNGGLFNGSTQYVRIPAASINNLTSGTIVQWVNGNSSQNSTSYGGYIAPLLGKQHSGVSTGPVIQFDATSLPAHIQFKMAGATTLTGTTAITANTWHQIALTWNGKTWQLFVDGVLDKSIANTATVANDLSADATTIGALIVNNNAALSGFFNGSIDETRIYNRALSPSDVQALYNFAPGPVVYYNFEEGSGSSVNDRSGYGNNGTWNGTGTQHWLSGKYGKAGNFNGTSDYISIPYASSIALSVGAYTIGTWIKPTSVSNFGYIFTDSGQALQFAITSSTVVRWPDGSTPPSLTTGLQPGQWQYVVGTYDGITRNLYVNGVLAWSGGRTFSGAAGGNRFIGSSGVNKYFAGQMDDFRIYNYAISQKQIVQDMNGGAATTSVGAYRSGPVGYWKFDEGYGTVANNAGYGGGSLNGTLTNMATAPSTSTSGWQLAGKFGKALAFDGTNDYVNISDNAALDPTSAITVSTWILPTASGSSGGDLSILNKGNIGSATGYSYGLLWSNTNTVAFLIGNSSTTDRVTSTALTLNKWSHIIGVYDGTNLKIYVNGQLSATKTTTLTSIQAVASPLIIGASWTTSAFKYFTGLIDEVKIYPYALSPQEVQLDYNHNAAIQFGSLGTSTSDGKTASNSASAAYCVPGDTTACTPPVGEWNFEEGSGTSVNDTSGNGNTGTWNGTGRTHWLPGYKGGTGGKFNGTDDYVVSSSVTNLPSGQSARTIESWIYPTNTNPGGVLVALNNAAGSSQSFIIDMANAAGIQYIFTDGKNSSNNVTISGSQIPSSNSWHHITFVFDGATSYSYYLDGTLQKTGTFAVTINTVPTTLNIGRRGDSVNTGAYFPGKIDQVRIYNYARTAAQVAWDYNRGGPVGWWKMDECQGATLNDASGNGNIGTINLSTTGTQTTAIGMGTCTTNASTPWFNGANGKFNSSLNFDGTDDYVSLGQPSALNITGPLTLSAWIKATALPGASGLGIITKDNGLGTVEQYALYLPSSNQKIRFLLKGSTSGVKVVDSNTIPATGVWIHVVGTWDGATMKLYVNGIQQTSTTALTDTSLVAAAVNVDIGKFDSVSTPVFPGQIDDVRVYNYALTPVQIQLLYNNNAAVRFAPLTGTP